jgi:hypothetical protein
MRAAIAFTILAATPALAAIYEDVAQLQSLNYDYVIVGGTLGLSDACITAAHAETTPRWDGGPGRGQSSQ